jgi:hypothetical protein
VNFAVKAREKSMRTFFGVVAIYLIGVAAAHCADRLVIQVTPVGARLELKRSNFFNLTEWRDLSESDKLTVGGGLVDDMHPDSLICNNSNVAIITLKGASWNMAVGKTGNASCDQCDRTPENQKWKVIEAE